MGEKCSATHRRTDLRPLSYCCRVIYLVPFHLQLTLHSLALISDTAPGGRVGINLEQSKDKLEALKKNPITIKEGVEYSVSISFS